jgi:hypothetical protein
LQLRRSRAIDAGHRRDAVVDKLVYTATNPVLDDLVERVRHWPGVHGLAARLAGRPLRATRPLHFFRRDGSMPDALELPLTIPPELGPAVDVLPSCASACAPSSWSAPPSGFAPVAAYWADAACLRSRGAITRRARRRGTPGRWDAALRCDIDVLLPCAMSNHYHAVIYDREGRYPEFIEYLHKLLDRSQNALRGRWENFWSCEQTCVVKLVDREAVIDKLVYTATNLVLDHVVD